MSQSTAPKGTVTLEDGTELLIELQCLCDILDIAHHRIREIYNESELLWDTTYKKDEQNFVSPLTKADLEANKIICDGLAKAFPTIPIISEEVKETPYEIRKTWSLVWIVDPIDGTKEFIKRTGEFTTNIGLSYNGVPIAGLVGVPLTDMIYVSFKDQGAFRRESLLGSFEPLTPTYIDERNEVIIVASKSHLNDQTREFVKEYRNAKFIQRGSSLKLIMCADGAAHLYPRAAPTSEWDTCAAHAIVSETGGTVNELYLNEKGCLEEREALTYNKENLLNPYFVVYCPRRKMKNSNL